MPRTKGGGGSSRRQQRRQRKQQQQQHEGSGGEWRLIDQATVHNSIEALCAADLLLQSLAYASVPVGRPVRLSPNEAAIYRHTRRKRDRQRQRLTDEKDETRGRQRQRLREKGDK